MARWQHEQSVDCPYCGELITVLVDPSQGDHQYVEDCQVCCQPIEFDVLVDYEGDIAVTVRSDRE